ncbi:sugar phosphate isomerase/epimerase family protein [Paenibacillus sp. y28]|uniref:sugar phosphate isomerase/epimerase family protein n=1 Tax=Paenibacillus sp. y28 TaxID=3129110 RepID=UPI00301AD1B5
MSLGVLAHNYGKLPYAELAANIGEAGFSYVQLALSKAIADVDCGLGKLSPGLATRITEAFHRQGVSIAVLGCYVDLIELDDTAFRNNIDRFKEHIRHARYFGNAMVASETGKPKPGADLSRHWARMRSAVEEIAEEAEKWGAVVALEVAEDHLVDTPEKLAQLLDEVPSSNLGVLLDPVNLLSQERASRQDEIVERAFELLGSRIVHTHAKDFIMNPEGQFQVVPAGQGQLNYPLFIERLNQYKPLVTMTLEQVKPHEAAASIRFLRDQFQQAAGPNVR